MSHLTSEFLDTNQYAYAEIQKYEAVYGYNFVSPGGEAMVKELLQFIELTAGMTVLDIGCGIGGSAFYLARNYDVQVHGLDLSTNMLHLAQERCQEAQLEHLVTFEHGDILNFEGRGQYDLVYSRDVFLHIHDKMALFKIIKDCLRPGGVLLFSDYCCGEGDKSPEFEAYIQERCYHLLSVAGYEALLKQAGFIDIVAQDQTIRFNQTLEDELAKIPQAKLSPPEIAELSQGWRDKIERVGQGEHRWGVFRANRPKVDNF
jgi:phosphoethanolamine N-methyltransferase